jgi:hypothetical protein
MASSITEREVAADLSQELNKYIDQGGTPFDKTSVERHAGSRYPDITVWTNFENNKAFSFWELKAPGFQEDLSVLPAKAEMVGARYIVVWNFHSGTLFEVQNGNLKDLQYYPIPLMSSLEEWRNPQRRIAVINQAQKILDDLSRLAQSLSLMPFNPDKVYFISILQTAIEQLVPILKIHIFEQKKNRENRENLNKWTVKQGYPLELSELDEMLARHWAYTLAVRILFYFTIRRYFPGLPDLKIIPGNNTPTANILKDAFSKAQGIDWQAVFEESPLDALGLPDEADTTIHKLLDGFNRYDFSQLKEDVIGQIMEGLIPEDQRHTLGQYFTREDLIDFIIGFVVRDDDAYYIDPTCGSGTFLNRLYSRLRWLSTYKSSHSQLLERIWGIDIAHFPAELATINLFRQNVSKIDNFPRIVVKDFFEIQPGQTLHFPPMSSEASVYEKISVALPNFEGVVGNFPYIRQELIEKQNKGYKKTITKAIAREWFWHDHDLFKTGTISAQDSKEWLKERTQDLDVELRLSGQADIYAYLFYHAAAFLKEGGRLGIVTSNSWLDVAYGLELKRFLLRHFKVVAIVASWCEPWFQDASVNTAFTILERCEEEQKRAENVVRFVKLKQPLAELLPSDLLLQEHARWQKVDTLVMQIENADAKFAEIDTRTGRMQPLQGVKTLEEDPFRIRLVPQAELEKELKEKGESAKWGLYIRAPQVYFDLLQEAGDKIIPLSEVADVRFGIKTGINDFFYLEPLGSGALPGTLQVKNSRGWIGDIEEACLRPVIKSPKEAKSMVINPAALRYRLFLPPLDSKDADAENTLRLTYPLAYQYVCWGKQQRTSAGQMWTEVPSVKSRKKWWFLGLPPKVDFLISRFIDQRFFIPAIKHTEIADTFFVGDVIKEDLVNLIIALMNSSIFFMEIEIKGRVNLGEGLLTFYGPDINSTLIINPDNISDVSRTKIIRTFETMQKRPIETLASEVRRKDRQALDTAVLEALGLDPRRYLPQIYQGLVEMVNERLTLPKMRIDRKKKEQRISFDQVKTKVQEELIPNGFQRVSAFLTAGTEVFGVQLTDRPQSWMVFFTEYTLLGAQGNEVGKIQGTETQARYAIYASLPGQYRVEVPSDYIAAGKAVQRYEHYLQDETRKLRKSILERTNDYQQTERLLREILEYQGLTALEINLVMAS